MSPVCHPVDATAQFLGRPIFRFSLVIARRVLCYVIVYAEKNKRCTRSSVYRRVQIDFPNHFPRRRIYENSFFPRSSTSKKKKLFLF